MLNTICIVAVDFERVEAFIAIANSDKYHQLLPLQHKVFIHSIDEFPTYILLRQKLLNTLLVDAPKKIYTVSSSQSTSCLFN